MYAYRQRRDEDFVDHRIAARLTGVTEGNVDSMSAIASPARAMQQRVEQAFAQTAAQPAPMGLSIRARFAIIAGLAAAAWLPVGALVFSLLG